MQIQKCLDDYDYCIHCGCDLTHQDDGDDTCCWCIERMQKEKEDSLRRILKSEHLQKFKFN